MSTVLHKVVNEIDGFEMVVASIPNGHKPFSVVLHDLKSGEYLSYANLFDTEAEALAYAEKTVAQRSCDKFPMPNVTFHRLVEKNWAINTKGRKIEYSVYLAIHDGRPIARISGYLRKDGSTGWMVEPVNEAIAIERKHCTLQNAKQAVAECFGNQQGINQQGINQ